MAPIYSQINLKQDKSGWSEGCNQLQRDMRNSPDELKADFILLWVTATEVNAIIKSKLTKHLKAIILLNIYYIYLFLNIFVR